MLQFQTKDDMSVPWLPHFIKCIPHKDLKSVVQSFVLKYVLCNNKQKCQSLHIFPLCYDRRPGMVPRQHCMQQSQRKCGMLRVNTCLIVRYTTTPGGSVGQHMTRDWVRNCGRPQKPLLLQLICPLQINCHLIYMIVYTLTKMIFNFRELWFIFVCCVCAIW